MLCIKHQADMFSPPPPPDGPGPLFCCASQVLFEGVPTYPDAGRCWQLVDKLKVTIFYTAPTAIRALHAKGDAYVTKYQRTSLRILGSVGECFAPAAILCCDLVLMPGRWGLPAGVLLIVVILDLLMTRLVRLHCFLFFLPQANLSTRMHGSESAGGSFFCIL